MTTNAATLAATAEAAECEYCGFAAYEGAILVAASCGTDPSCEHALCTYCADDYATGRTSCASPNTHGCLCDCADGLCD